MRNPSWQRDELLLACALVVQNGWKELRENDLQVMDLSDLLQVLPLHPVETRSVKFRSTGSVSRKTTDLATAHPSHQGPPTRGGRLDKEVVAAFIARPEEMLAAAERIRNVAVNGPFQLPAEPPDPDDEAAPEGRLLARLHHARERDPKLRARKIKSVLAAGGSLRCEACDFSFAETYGSLGDGYIEVITRSRSTFPGRPPRRSTTSPCSARTATACATAVQAPRSRGGPRRLSAHF